MASPQPTDPRPRRRPFGARAVVGLAALGLIIGFCAAMATDEKWLVSAKVLLQIGPETAGSRPSMVGSPAPFLAGNPRREDVQTEVELLGSPDLLRRAFTRLLAEDREQALGPESGRVATLLRELAEATAIMAARSREDRALDKWSGSMRIAVVPASTVLEIECRSARPAAAQRLLQILLELYLDDHRLAFGAHAMPAILGSFVTDREQALLTAEAKLTGIRTQLGVLDVVQEVTQLLRRRSDAETTASDLEGQLAAARARVDATARQLADTPPEQRLSAERRTNPTRDELELRLAKAHQDLAVAEQEFTTESPQVRQAREVVALLADLAGKAVVTRDAGEIVGRNPLHEVLLEAAAKAAADVHALTAQLAAATATIRGIAERLSAIERGRAALQKAEQDVAEAKLDLTRAHDGLRLARIEQVLDENKVANVTVVTPPSWLPTPMHSFGLPTRIAILFGGLALGGCLGLALVLWRRSADREAAVLALPGEPVRPVAGSTGARTG